MVGFMINRYMKQTGIINSSDSAKKKNNADDKLSQLQDDVLVTILSRLPMKEAARTSVLSNRWCKLWTCIPNLNFDAFDAFYSLFRLKEHLRIEARQKYINWVNHVLNSCQTTPSIDEFCVKFDLDAKYGLDIHSWVKFAIEKNVKSLTMHFPKHANFYRSRNHYTFPALCNSTKLFISLRKLDLKYVDIDGDFTQQIISSCSLLEELGIEASSSVQPVYLKIGPSLCLKRLKIVGCSYVKSIFLSAPNLSSFEYHGEVIDINYVNVPKLVDVSLGDDYFKYIFFNFPRLSNYVMLLQTLTILLRGAAIEQNAMLVEFPELPYLRNLKLNLYGRDDDTILYFASLIKAAPSLHKLELDIYWIDTDEWRARKVKRIAKCPHQGLKEVEVVGFFGQTFDMELIVYVLENSIALERVILDHQSSRQKSLGIGCPLNRQEHAMKQAKQLESEFSLGKKLVIL